MTVFLMLQGVMVLVVLNVLVGRFAHRRNDVHRNMLAADEAALRQLDHKIMEAQRHEHGEQQKINALTDAIALAEQQLASGEKDLDAARKAPPDLYYVFDRLEPKPGIIWEVKVGRQLDVPMGARMAAAWRRPRRYLIAAKTPKEAGDRAAQRFFEKAGLSVEGIATCPLFLSKRDERTVRPSAGQSGGDRSASTAIERSHTS
ncbi:hypothetical protein JZU48_00245 [bacterium]|nr:hypothetical protein [bacterium]